MKKHHSIVVVSFCMLFIAGCAHYQSSGFVSISPARADSEQINYSEFQDQEFDTWREVQILSDIASNEDSGSYEIRYLPASSLLELCVTTSNPKRSTVLCNKIINAYISMTNTPVRKEIKMITEPDVMLAH